MTTKRMSRADSEMQKALSQIISKFDDSIFSTTIFSITKVDAYADFSMAKIYVSVFGDDEKKKILIDKLNDNKKAIRFELAHSMRFKKVPDVLFVLDDTEEKAEKLNELFKQIEGELPDEE